MDHATPPRRPSRVGKTNATSEARTVRLPFELLEHIAEYLLDDRKTLEAFRFLDRACAAAALRTLRECSSSLRSLMGSLQPRADFEELVAVTTTNTDLARTVKQLSLITLEATNLKSLDRVSLPQLHSVTIRECTVPSAEALSVFLTAHGTTLCLLTLRNVVTVSNAAPEVFPHIPPLWTCIMELISNSLQLESVDILRPWYISSDGIYSCPLRTNPARQCGGVVPCRRGDRYWNEHEFEDNCLIVGGRAEACSPGAVV